MCRLPISMRTEWLDASANPQALGSLVSQLTLLRRVALFYPLSRREYTPIVISPIAGLLCIFKSFLGFVLVFNVGLYPRTTCMSRKRSTKSRSPAESSFYSSYCCIDGDGKNLSAWEGNLLSLFRTLYKEVHIRKHLV